MAWLEFTVNTSSCGAEAAAAALTARGFSDLVIEDEQEFSDFLEENRACWDYIDEELQQELKGLSRVRLYLEDTDSRSREILESYAAEAGLPLTMKPLDDTDWSESWKDSYPPMEIGRTLAVVPYWLADSWESERTPVILDPGLTFGTGYHPSTRMVMTAMEEAGLQPGFHCLDLGSGSGILSITALRLGAGKAVGVDIDAKAEDAARENAGYNGYTGPEFTPLTGDVTKDRQLMQTLSEQHWDLVLVNIVADVIIALAPVLPAFLAPDTLLICSGILDVRLEDVTRALTEAGLTVTHTRAEEDWRCVTAGRRQ